MKTKRILIIDDHPAMRHGIAQLIAREKDLKVCAEAGNRRETLAVLQKETPDIVILDISLDEAGISGLDLIGDICAHAGSVPILVYSMHDERVYAERALRSGACGYLMKQAPVQQLVGAIRKILIDGIYLSPEMQRRLLLGHVGRKSCFLEPMCPEDCLSQREFEVFRLIGMGLRPREIARQLHLSVKTIETHRMNIRKKLSISDAPSLARYAVAWVHRPSLS